MPVLTRKLGDRLEVRGCAMASLRDITVITRMLNCCRERWVVPFIAHVPMPLPLLKSVRRKTGKQVVAPAAPRQGLPTTVSSEFSDGCHALLVPQWMMLQDEQYMSLLRRGVPIPSSSVIAHGIAWGILRPSAALRTSPSTLERSARSLCFDALRILDRGDFGKRSRHGTVLRDCIVAMSFPLSTMGNGIQPG